eukprot:7625049-Heterocapsa_arctica.AAC.1
MAYITAQEATEEADAVLGNRTSRKKGVGPSNSGGQRSPSKGGCCQATEPGNDKNVASNRPGKGPYGGISSGGVCPQQLRTGIGGVESMSRDAAVLPGHVPDPINPHSAARGNTNRTAHRT